MEMKKFYEGIYPNFDAGLFEKIREAFPSIDTKQTIRRLSKGMQKQVAFWLAISARPQILILDEPVDGLDPVMRRQIWSLILQDVTEHGTTVLVSSHNLRELEDVCDHVGIMNHGKIIIERSLSELQSSICKIQAAFQAEMPKLPKDLEVLHMSTTGRSPYDDRKRRTQTDQRAVYGFKSDVDGCIAVKFRRNIYLRVRRC